MIRYQGHNRNDVAILGAPPENMTAEQFVRDKFNHGWRDLIVTDTETGETLGKIERNRETGKRQWWAESAESMQLERAREVIDGPQEVTDDVWAEALAVLEAAGWQ